MELSLPAVFGAGLLTFLTPCVLPIVPIYLTALLGGDPAALAGKRRGLLIVRAALFAVGFISVFTVMGLGASSIGGFFSEHRIAVQLVGALLVFILGLKFIGVLSIPLLDRVAKADDTRVATRFGGINAFVMGLVFAAGWSPCVGPVLGSVLTLAAVKSTSPLVGAGYLSVYGLGFALPLLGTAAFAEAALKLIGRISPHLPRIERGIGLLMIGVAGYLALGAYQDASIIPETTRGEALSSLVAGDRDSEPMPSMVELYADDCVVCQRMAPVVEGLSEQCNKRGVRVKTINVSAPAYRHLPQVLGVVGVPTFLFIDEFGLEAARLVGEQSDQTLRQGLSALRGTACPGLVLLDDGTDALAFPAHRNGEKGNACSARNAEMALAMTTGEVTAAPTEPLTVPDTAGTSPDKTCNQTVQ